MRDIVRVNTAAAAADIVAIPLEGHTGLQPVGSSTRLLSNDLARIDIPTLIIHGDATEFYH